MLLTVITYKRESELLLCCPKTITMLHSTHPNIVLPLVKVFPSELIPICSGEIQGVYIFAAQKGNEDMLLID